MDLFSLDFLERKKTYGTVPHFQLNNSPCLSGLFIISWLSHTVIGMSIHYLVFVHSFQFAYVNNSLHELFTGKGQGQGAN